MTEIKFVDKHGAVDDVRDDAVEVVQLRGGPSDELDVRSLLDVLQRDLPRSITGTYKFMSVSDLPKFSRTFR